MGKDLNELQALFDAAEKRSTTTVVEPDPVEAEQDTEGDLARALALLQDVRDMLSAMSDYIYQSDGKLGPFFSKQIPLIEDEIGEFLDEWDFPDDESTAGALDDEEEAAIAAMNIDLRG